MAMVVKDYTPEPDYYADRLLIPGLKKALEVIRSTAPGCEWCEGPYYTMIDELEAMLKAAEDAEQFKKEEARSRKMKEDAVFKLYNEMMQKTWLQMLQMQGRTFAGIKK